MRTIEVIEACVGSDFMYPVGVHEVPADIARSLISAGLAKPVQVIEKKVIKKVQNGAENIQAKDSRSNGTRKSGRGKASSKG
jgi:hypothetical protein